jgi:hypothetical protein
MDVDSILKLSPSVSSDRSAQWPRSANARESKPSAASMLNLRVQPLQFCSGIVDFELPVHAALFGVGLVGPDPNL